MKLQTLAAACAALVSVSAASAALAGEPITAKLQTPVAQPTKFIAGGAMFMCEGDACYAQAPTSTTYSTATCKIIAGKVGFAATAARRSATSSHDAASSRFPSNA